MNKVLFLSYDGILEPLGFSQILAYLLPLSKYNELTIISFEKEIDLQNNLHHTKIKELLYEHNIKWKYLIYKKNYLKYINLFKVFFYLFYYIKFKKINIVHARSYIPALITFFLKKIIKTKFIFDMRGFWIDERVEWNNWSKNSLKYIIFKYFEKKIILNSDAIITLTNIASKIIKHKYSLSNSGIKFQNIPTCVNLQKSHLKKEKNINNIVLAHLGSIGSRYNFKKYLKLGNIMKYKIDIFYSIINKGEHSYINDELKKNNVRSSNYNLEYVLPYNIHNSLKNVDLGVFFPVKGFYLNGYFPTKLGEFLTNGIPIITCKINDDVDSIIIQNKIGLIIDDMDNFKFDQVNHKIINNLLSDETSKKCIKVAESYFDVNKATRHYNKIYNII